MTLHVFHTGMRPLELVEGDLFRDPNTHEVWTFGGVSITPPPSYVWPHRCYLHNTRRCVSCTEASRRCFPYGHIGLHISHMRMRLVDVHVLARWERVRRR